MAVAAMKCPVCHSAELSPEGSYRSFDNSAAFPGMGGRGLLGAKDLVVSARRARVCLECGHLMLFVGESEREQMRAAAE